MKTYLKPDVTVENLFSAKAIANDPFDYAGGDGNELEVSATDWWDLLGNNE